MYLNVNVLMSIYFKEKTMNQKFQVNGCGVGLCAWGILILVVMVSMAVDINASLVYDDFEDGDLVGWTPASGGGGGGSTGVEAHSNSQMGFVKHNGIGWHNLSSEFDYDSECVLSFYMHAVAVKVDGGGGWKHASCGVKVSLLNQWNSELGSFTLINATDSSWLVSGDVLIDGSMHHYSATMADYASQAGLSESDSISKINLEFFTNADQWHPSYQSGWYDSYATVWIDNVNITPEPATLSLLALGVLALLRNRK